MTANRNDKKRAAPLSIPLNFEQAVDGLLQVDPKKPVDSKREPEKPAKPNRKKKPYKRPGK